MEIEWAIIDITSILVENFLCVYFLNSRFKSKYNSYWSQIVTWLVLVVWGLAAVISAVNIFAFAAYGIMFIYLFIFKHGTIPQKVFGVLAVCAIEISTSIIGAGLASVIEDTTIKHTLEYQDTSRLLSVVLVKMIQVVVFYFLAKKHSEVRNLQKHALIVLCGVAVFDFIFLFMLRMYVESPVLQEKQNHLLVWLAIGALVIMIAIFMIYELFIREEVKNVELALKLQRFKFESNYFKEMDSIYSDMRIWQHDYKNNLSALRALIKKEETKKALEFIDQMHSETYKNEVMLQTGNLVLDAIVSSKLWLAQAQNIEVDIQTMYPENVQISDNDLCAIVGNLIDNAIEACSRMEEPTEKKFIVFSLMKKKQNLLISISNSFNNELKRKGKRYFTVKNEPFHGLGIRHIDDIVDKYQGHVMRSQKDGVFETNILLPLMRTKETDHKQLRHQLN